jgi:hypothetical protein
MSWLSPDAYVATRVRPDSRPDLYVGFSKRNDERVCAADPRAPVGVDGRANEDSGAEAHWLATLAFTAIAGFAAGAFATALLALLLDALP